MPVNLSLYLVTDSTPKILGDRDLCSVVEQAVQGGMRASRVLDSLFKPKILTYFLQRIGVTIVQYRDKHSDTKELIKTAAKLHDITLNHGIPLIINDRVDVALAVGAEGVHLGQDDMSTILLYSLRFQLNVYANEFGRHCCCKKYVAQRNHYWSHSFFS